MSVLVTVLHIAICVLLVIVVLLQAGKGGGMGALSGMATQGVFGGRGAGNFLTRMTSGLAIGFFATSMLLAYLSSRAGTAVRAEKIQAIEAASAGAGPAPAATPAASAAPSLPVAPPAAATATPGSAP